MRPWSLRVGYFVSTLCWFGWFVTLILVIFKWVRGRDPRKSFQCHIWKNMSLGYVKGVDAITGSVAPWFRSMLTILSNPFLLVDYAVLLLLKCGELAKRYTYQVCRFFWIQFLVNLVLVLSVLYPVALFWILISQWKSMK